MPNLIRICTEAYLWLGARVGSYRYQHCTARDKEDQSSLSMPINTSSRDLVSISPAVIGVILSENSPPDKIILFKRNLYFYLSGFIS